MRPSMPVVWRVPEIARKMGQHRALSHRVGRHGPPPTRPPLAPHQIAPLPDCFPPERVGRLVGSHVLHPGHGSAWADRWPAPRALLVEPGGNYSLAGDPAALVPAD